MIDFQTLDNVKKEEYLKNVEEMVKKFFGNNASISLETKDQGRLVSNALPRNYLILTENYLSLNVLTSVDLSNIQKR